MILTSRARRLEVRKGSPEEVRKELSLEKLTEIRGVGRRWEGVNRVHMDSVNSEF